MKDKSKIVVYICAGLTLTLVVIWVGSAAYSGWKGYVLEKRKEAALEALTKPYREDIYGGKTPEETWAMFLDALKKEDVELASKYIVVDKQDEWKKIIEDTINQKGEIEINRLENINFDSRLGDTMYYYRLVDEGGERVNSSIIFTLNPYTQVWKISLL